jgi:hypothetical protein
LAHYLLSQAKSRVKCCKRVETSTTPERAPGLKGGGDQFSWPSRRSRHYEERFVQDWILHRKTVIVGLIKFEAKGHCSSNANARSTIVMYSS